MRIDKFLKVSRLVKRRETAKELCDDGDVMINGKKAKASSEVVPSDIVSIRLGRHDIEIEVLEVRGFANKEQAHSLYSVHSDVTKERKENV